MVFEVERPLKNAKTQISILMISVSYNYRIPIFRVLFKGLIYHVRFLLKLKLF